MGKLNGVTGRDKKLMVKLSCGHTIVINGHEVSSRMSGNHVDCRKCSPFSDPRRVVEKQWISGRKEDEY